MCMKFVLIVCLLLFSLAPINTQAQTPGIIVRPAGTSGPIVLDPNADGYTSLTKAGFGLNDVTTSEIPYKVVPPVHADPTGDLFRGASGGFSDLVKGIDSSGFYLFNDGANLLCRLRMGGIVSGSKGYSILIDTDGKFGNIGADADPNYVPATSGTNGNPGFELEIVLETNSQVAVYNVDGTSTPVLMSTYTIPTNSQISVAGSTAGGNPDFFYDFYVPFASLGISASTPIRVVATTVMSPTTAIGGPVSDIYGVSTGNYMTQWTTAIESQPPFTFNSIGAGGPGIGAIRTSPPVLNGPIYPTSTTITGTWTASVYTKFLAATITLYDGVNIIGTATVASGNTWTITVSGLLNNDVITAVAQATGESKSVISNIIIVNTCNAGNSPATPILTCSSGSKGINGTNLSTGWIINVDDRTIFATDNSKINASGLFGSNIGSSPGITWQYSGGCVGGNPLTQGSYKIYYTDTITGCSSQPVYFCAAGMGSNSLAGLLNVPVITTPANADYTPATTVITGSIASGTTMIAATLTLYVDGQIVKTTTATSAGLFTFNNLVLLPGQQLYIIAEKSTGTPSTSYCESRTGVFTVACFTSTPIFNVSNSNQLIDGAAVTGTSSELAGTLIYVYNSANALVVTTSVQNDGSWSSANAGSTPTNFTPVAGTSYYANAKNGICGISGNSALVSTSGNTSIARCGTIQSAVGATDPNISGTLTGLLANTVVNLYQDGSLIGSSTTSTLVWGPIPVNTGAINTLYAGGVLTIGIAEPLKNEIICLASTTVSCTPPNVAIFTPATSTIHAGNSVIYTLTSPQAGILYSLRDATDVTNMGTSGFYINPNVLTLVSNIFNTQGTYTINVKATNFSGANCQSLSPATVIVTAPVPLTLASFDGTYEKGIAKLNWSTSSEQDLDIFQLQKSYSGTNFFTEAIIKAAGNSDVLINYSFTDSSIKAPIVYYRLKMIDKGLGKYSYSSTIALHADNGIVSTSISPNPFVNAINIKMNALKEMPLVISLTDIAGRKLKSINYTVKQGDNNIIMSGLQSVLKGTYIIELMMGNQSVYHQLLIK